MKIIFIVILLLFSVDLFSQSKFVLLNRSYYKDAVFVDSITKEYTSTGYFPIQANQLDSFLTLVGQFRKLFKQGMDRKYFNNDEFKTSSIIFDISTSTHTYADRYDIDIISFTGQGTYKMKLSDLGDSESTTDKYIEAFYDYLKKTIKQRDKQNNK